MRYIALPIERDPVEAEEQSFEVIRAQWPDWRADDADPMAMLLRASAVLYADLAELATRMAEEAFRYFGRGLVDLPPIDDRPATVTVRITAQDAAGPYTVPEGLEVGGRNATGELVGFRVPAEAVIPNGVTTVDVPAEASELGAGSNGITGAGEFLEYVDYLTAVEFVTVSAGGVDREADEAFLDRLAEELGLQAPRPIVAADFAVLARRLAGVGYRATAIDGLDPVAVTTGNERMVAVALVDPAGNAATVGVKTIVRDALEAMREATFSVPVFDPTYTTVDAAFTATALPGWNPADVLTAATAALVDFFSPSTWGQRRDTGEELEWRNVPLARWGEAHEVLQRVEGLEFVESLALGKNGGPLGGIGEDVTLDGFAPLPLPGSIGGTVAAGAP